MIKDVADTLFFVESKNEGNLSQALDWILREFRNNSKYSDLMNFLHYRAVYLRGHRDEKDIEAMRSLLTFIESVKNVTE